MVRLFFIWVILVSTAGCTQRKIDLDSGLSHAEMITPESSKTATRLSHDYTEGVLPRALYYLSHINANTSQVWRIPANGSEAELLTSEGEKISDYDVNLRDGTLAYITDNQLFLQKSSGEKTGSIQEASSRITSPLWSPDGQELAFGYNGINLYQIDQNRVTPLFNDREVAHTGEIANYSPYLWSPDGSKLLVIISLNFGTTLGILSLDTKEIVQLHAPIKINSNTLVCCEATWSTDSQSIYVANPYPNSGYPTGLWSFDTQTGDGVNLIPPVSQDGTYNLAGWPHVSSDGELTYFFTNSPQLPKVDGSMTIMRIGSRPGSQASLLRPDSFLIKEVLWAPQGDLAVIVMPSPGSNEEAGGPVILVRSDGSPVQPLATGGDHLRWGP